ncbi:serine/threonine protein kinase [Gorillibacterium sp. sgz500922]|uniref:serine/threonine protein kinase n=1 Tax=Gorillibacterium sp. sgz500922 TaxID=3446694 RepID=UPI003F670B11
MQQPHIRQEPLKPGDLVGNRYRILSEIGRGGMSTVYLAEDTRLPEKVWALKASLRHACDPRGFEEEARMLSHLEHPFLLKAVDFFPPDERGYSFLVTDYIKGKTLQACFEQGELTVRRVMEIAGQLSSLFDYLHHLEPKPVIYRDLKPGNVMIDEQGHVRLIDFGIARNYSAGSAGDTVSFGTLGFASPEQLEQGTTDARSDLYSLGALCHYLLYQGAHYRGGELSEAGHVPPELRALLVRLLQRNPDRRFQTARELSATIADVLNRPTASVGGGPAGFPASPAAPAAAQLRRQMLIAGSLYPGAGSTFFAVALCRSLASLGLAHTLIEFPANEPELYSLLHGEKHAPPRYRSVQELLQRQLGDERRPWRDRFTEWLPLDPERPAEAADSFIRLLPSVKNGIAILDLSSNWSHPAAREWIAMADGIIGVAGPHPAKLAAPSCRSRVRLLAEWKEQGRPVYLAGTRDSGFAGRKEWLEALPFSPSAVLPELPAQAVLEAEWKGKRVQDDPVLGPRLEEALRPLLAELLPDGGDRRSRKGLRGWFRRA